MNELLPGDLGPREYVLSSAGGHGDGGASSRVDTVQTSELSSPRLREHRQSLTAASVDHSRILNSGPATAIELPPHVFHGEPAPTVDATRQLGTWIEGENAVSDDGNDTAIELDVKPRSKRRRSSRDRLGDAGAADRAKTVREPAGAERAQQQSLALEALPSRRSRPSRNYEERLPESFSVIDNPRRFFSRGRIFRTVWFEAGNSDTPVTRADYEWTTACPPFHGERAYARYRWFVVVRKRLHHSLCFPIVTMDSGADPLRFRRGRGQDFVVLHSWSAPPPQALPEEEIKKEPIAVVIEDPDQQFIPPSTRMDCGRIYTVEDNLRVQKVGRVHRDWLERLEAYYKESVG